MKGIDPRVIDNNNSEARKTWAIRRSLILRRWRTKSLSLDDDVSSSASDSNKSEVSRSRAVISTLSLRRLRTKSVSSDDDVNPGQNDNKSERRSMSRIGARVRSLSLRRLRSKTPPSDDDVSSRPSDSKPEMSSKRQSGARIRSLSLRRLRSKTPSTDEESPCTVTAGRAGETIHAGTLTLTLTAASKTVHRMADATWGCASCCLQRTAAALVQILPHSAVKAGLYFASAALPDLKNRSLLLKVTKVLPSRTLKKALVTYIGKAPTTVLRKNLDLLFKNGPVKRTAANICYVLRLPWCAAEGTVNAVVALVIATTNTLDHIYQYFQHRNRREQQHQCQDQTFRRSFRQTLRRSSSKRCQREGEASPPEGSPSSTACSSDTAVVSLASMRRTRRILEGIV